ncbi:hypothetical protein AKO1_003630 [Acrasis kona]|uniref:Uncharacterized protein n=1 Tax=Acrasis kona TaxID=1008807 RepID=A0AAW2Z823_9EUKA
MLTNRQHISEELNNEWNQKSEDDYHRRDSGKGSFVAVNEITLIISTLNFIYGLLLSFDAVRTRTWTVIAIVYICSLVTFRMTLSVMHDLEASGGNMRHINNSTNTKIKLTLVVSATSFVCLFLESINEGNFNKH